MWRWFRVGPGWGGGGGVVVVVVVEETMKLHPIRIHSARQTELLLDEILRYLRQDDATVGILAQAVTWAIKSTTFGPLVTPQCLI